jgi:hypothetical protein
MRRTRRTVIAAAGSILLGAVAAGVAFASAANASPVTVGGCQILFSSSTYECTATGTASAPQYVALSVMPTPSSYQISVQFDWTINCGAGDTQGTTDGGGPALSGGYPEVFLPLGVTDPSSCSVTVTTTNILSAGGTTAISVSILDFPRPAPTPTATPTPSPVSSVAASPVRLVRGFDGTCLRDMGIFSHERYPARCRRMLRCTRPAVVSSLGLRAIGVSRYPGALDVSGVGLPAVASPSRLCRSAVAR